MSTIYLKDTKTIEKGLAMVLDLVSKLNDDGKLETVNYIKLENLRKEEKITINGPSMILCVDNKCQMIYVELQDYSDEKHLGSKTFKMSIEENNNYASQLMNKCREVAKKTQLKDMEESITRLLNIK